MLYRIADFNIDFENPSKLMQQFLSEYASCGSPDFIISVSDDDIAKTLSDSPTLSRVQAELTAYHHKLLSVIPQSDAFFLHASLIDVHSTGIAFTALSGVGKTTHTLLWKELLGDKLKIINGDKPIIRFLGTEATPYGYGTPWNGKEGLGTNAKTPIKHICFIERGETNSCYKIAPQEVLGAIFNQLYIPSDSNAVSATLELLNRLLDCCTLWKIVCNTDISAAELAYHTIFKENINEA